MCFILLWTCVLEMGSVLRSRKCFVFFFFQNDFVSGCVFSTLGSTFKVRIFKTEKIAFIPCSKALDSKKDVKNDIIPFQAYFPSIFHNKNTIERAIFQWCHFNWCLCTRVVQLKFNDIEIVNTRYNFKWARNSGHFHFWKDFHFRCACD